jgi:aspartate kinase
MFRTLADERVNLRMISTSPITISCLIPRSDLERAVRALREAFALDPSG